MLVLLPVWISQGWFGIGRYTSEKCSITLGMYLLLSPLPICLADLFSVGMHVVLIWDSCCAPQFGLFFFLNQIYTVIIIMQLAILVLEDPYIDNLTFVIAIQLTTFLYACIDFIRSGQSSDLKEILGLSCTITFV